MEEFIASINTSATHGRKRGASPSPSKTLGLISPTDLIQQILFRQAHAIEWVRLIFNSCMKPFIEVATEQWKWRFDAFAREDKGVTIQPRPSRSYFLTKDESLLLELSNHF